MLFGQSLFQSVVTRLKTEHEDDLEEATDESFRIRGLGMGFVASTTDEADVTGTGTEAYFAFLHDQPDLAVAETIAPPSPDEVVEHIPEPPAPAHLLRLTREEIADELAITAQDTEPSLAEKRRRFAKANHPDRVAPDYRDNANIRMQTANLLIDEAIKRLAWR
ncbi:hypothetical protein EPK99_09170 [Neorhizobium lilium]|uniref:J domain-containing protein n=1 Tax=Neorhizobium lilium TaxID=2503024 RepID=A0A444LIA2_9HYPH|nr:hypothetical protein [Neorhizobium lilium]RWX78751.1 hypothetical protein EPK99_09170 [Neorhizobium lilium]